MLHAMITKAVRYAQLMHILFNTSSFMCCEYDLKKHDVSFAVSDRGDRLCKPNATAFINLATTPCGFQKI